MAKTNHQKEKLLVLLEILRTESDETHPLVVPRLIEKLQARGIAAERKSIYDDLDTLRRKGYDIVLHRGKGYYLGEREVQLAELKLLVDAVQSSRFITAKKSNELIEKLERQTSIYGAQTLQRQVFVAGRVKSMNESVYYNIDAIHKAIGENRQITFRYFDYDMHRNKVFRREGRRYAVSPYGLIWNSENYYLVAYDISNQEMRHYRVDKMAELAVTCLPLEGADGVLISHPMRRSTSVCSPAGRGRLPCAAATVWLGWCWTALAGTPFWCPTGRSTSPSPFRRW